MTKRVVIAGAGVAAVDAVLALRHVAGGDFAIDIVAPAQPSSTGRPRSPRPRSRHAAAA
jgi:NADH dehydrogenase FAD-containing subunit